MPSEGFIQSVRTIVILGKSLALSTVGASLQEHTGMQLLMIDLNASNIEHQLDALDPDVALFDLKSPPYALAIALLKSNPRRFLIGADLATNEALVISAQTIQLRTVEDLATLIENYLTETPRPEPIRQNDVPEGKSEMSGSDRQRNLDIHN